MPMAMTGSKGAAGVGRGRARAAAQRRAAVPPALERSASRSLGKRSGDGRGALDEHAAAKRRRVGAREMPPEAGSDYPAPRVDLQVGDRASARKRDPRASGRHADRTNTRNGYLKLDRVWRRRPSATWPRLPHRRLPRWRVRTRARAYESEDSLFRARASEQIASWCLRVGMLMKLRASSSSIRCCGVALNDCSPPWMPSKK
jgi:hypothetical protein